MDLGLVDSVAVVFGAARGIGAAIARAFAAEGAQIVAVDRDPSVHDLGTPTRSFVSLTADVTDYGAVSEIGLEVAQRFGRCNHVVFAVGIGSGKFGFPFWKLEPTDWDLVLKVNLIGAVNVAHALRRAGEHSVPKCPARYGGPVMLIASSLVSCRPNRLAD